MPLKMIRLELARTKEFPQGSPDRGYEFVAPLTEDGHLDRDGWAAHRDACTVHRFWPGEDDERGRLVHRGSAWYFHYDGMEAGEDEPIFKFDRQTFNPGDYVSVTEHDEVQRPFRVVSVRPAAG